MTPREMMQRLIECEIAAALLTSAAPVDDPLDRPVCQLSELQAVEVWRRLCQSSWPDRRPVDPGEEAEIVALWREIALHATGIAP